MRHLIIYIILYLFFVFYYAFEGYKEEIPTYMFYIQILYALCYFIALCYAYKNKSIKYLLVNVCLYSIFFSGLLRWCFWTYTGMPFASAVDSYNYESFAVTSLHFIKDFPDYVSYILSIDFMKFDDLGYTTFCYIVYNLFGNAEVARNVMLFVNALFITFSSLFLYKLMVVLSIKKTYARFLGGVWGFFPFFSVTSAVGLKENIFCFFVIGAFYFMYSYKENKFFISLFLFFVFILMCAFFRIAVAFMLFLSFIIIILTNEKNKKGILMVFLLFFLIGISLLSILINMMGRSWEILLATTNDRFKSMGGGSNSFKWGVQIMSAFIGPFPNFSRAVSYGFIHSAGLLFKVIISFPFILGVYYVVRDLEYRYYPLLAFVFMGMVMLVIAGVALDMRYQVTFFSMMLPIIALSFSKRCFFRSLYGIYICCIIFTIMLYNMR